MKVTFSTGAVKEGPIPARKSMNRTDFVKMIQEKHNVGQHKDSQDNPRALQEERKQKEEAAAKRLEHEELQKQYQEIARKAALHGIKIDQPELLEQLAKDTTTASMTPLQTIRKSTLKLGDPEFQPSPIPGSTSMTNRKHPQLTFNKTFDRIVPYNVKTLGEHVRSSADTGKDTGRTKVDTTTAPKMRSSGSESTLEPKIQRFYKRIDDFNDEIIHDAAWGQGQMSINFKDGTLEEGHVAQNFRAKHVQTSHKIFRERPLKLPKLTKDL